MKKLATIYLLLTLCLFSVEGQNYRPLSPKPLNTTDWEFAPTLYDSGIVFMSSRIIPSTQQPIKHGGDPLLNLWYLPFDEDGKLGKGKSFDELFKTDAVDGPIAFAQRDEMACICLQNGYAGQYLPKNGNSGIYFAYKSNDQWGDLTPFVHNDENVNYTSPFLTEDGLTLYFAADSIAGSYGGWDIYVSHMEGNSWSVPKNLGDNINTAEWDFFPFYHPSGILYFSSRGHDSRGGSFDIFESTFYNDSWSDPIPFSNIVNSYSDEISIYLMEDFSKGYFSRKTDDDFDIIEISTRVPETFDNPRPIQKNRFCFRLRENSLDTIDYTLFEYEWVINDTLTVAGHDIKFCFPGPGDYHLSFNVTNKVTDTTMYGVASLNLKLELMEQPVITVSADTVFVMETIYFSADETHWNRWEIDEYYWNFDFKLDSDKTKNVKYQYKQPGEYNVVLGIKEKGRGRKFEAEKAAVVKKIVVLEE